MTMELICPSCEARYQVPDASIGEKGRQVSCMNCGNSWHAFPPLVLGSSAAPPTTASPGIDWQAPPRPGRSSAAPAHAAEIETAPSAAARPPEAAPADQLSRSEQLAEIREMLAEVQSEERAAAALAPRDDENGAGDAPAAAPVRPAPPDPELPPEPEPTADRPTIALPELDDQDDEETDPLRRRMAMLDRENQKRRTDVEKLRRRHDRRAHRQKRAHDVKSGAFLTGFLLIVMIGAVMAALYLLHPQIVARMPGSEAMMAEYVATIDALRAKVAEVYGYARDWVLALVEGNA